MHATGQRVIHEVHENGSVNTYHEREGRKKEERRKGREPGREERPDKNPKSALLFERL